MQPIKLALAVLVACSPITAAQNVPLIVEKDRILVEDHVTLFGSAMAMDGNWLVVSRFTSDTPWTSGSVEAYHRQGETWTLDQILTGSDTDILDRFGGAVAFCNNQLIITAPYAEGVSVASGAFYVFERIAGSWQEVQKVLNPGTDFDGFGFDMAAEGDVIAIGAPESDEYAPSGGVVRIFRSGINGWELEQSLFPTGGSPSLRLGGALDMDGGILAVGATDSADLAGEGHVYLWTNSAGTFQDEAHVVDPRPTHVDHFANELALSEWQLLVSGPRSGTFGDLAGEVWAYERTAPGLWELTQSLGPPELTPGQGFGEKISLKSGRAVITGFSRSYDYLLEGGSWSRTAVFQPATPVGPLVNVVQEDDLVILARPHHASYLAEDILLFDRTVPMPAEIFCPGDGTGSPCPCGNESNVGAQQGCLTSERYGCQIYASGSASVSADDLVIHLINAPSIQPSLLFAGPDSIQGGQGLPFGDGLRCVAGPVVRLGAPGSPPSSWGPGTASILGVSAGEVLYFQAWFRNPIGPCGPGFNTTNGLRVTFVP